MEESEEVRRERKGDDLLEMRIEYGEEMRSLRAAYAQLHPGWHRRGTPDHHTFVHALGLYDASLARLSDLALRISRVDSNPVRKWWSQRRYDQFTVLRSRLRWDHRTEAEVLRQLDQNAFWSGPKEVERLIRTIETGTEQPEDSTRLLQLNAMDLESMQKPDLLAQVPSPQLAELTLALDHAIEELDSIEGAPERSGELLAQLAARSCAGAEPSLDPPEISSTNLLSRSRRSANAPRSLLERLDRLEAACVRAAQRRFAFMVFLGFCAVLLADGAVLAWSAWYGGRVQYATAFVLGPPIFLLLLFFSVESTHRTLRQSSDRAPGSEVSLLDLGPVRVGVYLWALMLINLFWLIGGYLGPWVIGLGISALGSGEVTAVGLLSFGVVIGSLASVLVYFEYRQHTRSSGWTNVASTVAYVALSLSITAGNGLGLVQYLYILLNAGTSTRVLTVIPLDLLFAIGGVAASLIAAMVGLRTLRSEENRKRERYLQVAQAVLDGLGPSSSLPEGTPSEPRRASSQWIRLPQLGKLYDEAPEETRDALDRLRPPSGKGPPLLFDVSSNGVRTVGKVTQARPHGKSFESVLEVTREILVPAAGEAPPSPEVLPTAEGDMLRLLERLSTEGKSLRRYVRSAPMSETMPLARLLCQDASARRFLERTLREGDGSYLYLLNSILREGEEGKPFVIPADDTYNQRLWPVLTEFDPNGQAAQRWRLPGWDVSLVPIESPPGQRARALAYRAIPIERVSTARN